MVKTSSGLRISPFISMMITLLFVFSTAYGLMFYYFQAEAKTLNSQGLSSTAADPTALGTSGSFFALFVSGIFDTILSFLAFISPFELIRGLIQFVSPKDLFLVLDIFLLRPMSWSVSILTGNWILSKVRGTSEGT